MDFEKLAKPDGRNLIVAYQRTGREHENFLRVMQTFKAMEMRMKEVPLPSEAVGDDTDLMQATRAYERLAEDMLKACRTIRRLTGTPTLLKERSREAKGREGMTREDKLMQVIEDLMPVANKSRIAQKMMHLMKAPERQVMLDNLVAEGKLMRIKAQSQIRSDRSLEVYFTPGGYRKHLATANEG